MTRAQISLLKQIRKEPMMVTNLSPRQRITCAALMAQGAVTIKSTLNTARATITRLGHEILDFQLNNKITSRKALNQIEQEIVRLQLREDLDIQHRLNQPQHLQRKG